MKKKTNLDLNLVTRKKNEIHTYYHKFVGRRRGKNVRQFEQKRKNPQNIHQDDVAMLIWCVSNYLHHFSKDFFHFFRLDFLFRC